MSLADFLFVDVSTFLLIFLFFFSIVLSIIFSKREESLVTDEIMAVSAGNSLKKMFQTPDRDVSIKRVCLLVADLGVLVIQVEGDLVGAFANGNSIVGNASLFFGVKSTKMMCCATIPDLCLVLLPILAYSYQSSLLIGIPPFSFL